VRNRYVKTNSCKFFEIARLEKTTKENKIPFTYMAAGPLKKLIPDVLVSFRGRRGGAKLQTLKKLASLELPPPEGT